MVKKKRCNQRKRKKISQKRSGTSKRQKWLFVSGKIALKLVLVLVSVIVKTDTISSEIHKYIEKFIHLFG